MRDLSEIRVEIDAIDNELLALFCRRMDCAKEVAYYKKERSLPILNQQREDEILSDVREKGGAYGEAAQELFAELMKLSRALQQEIMDEG